MQKVLITGSSGFIGSYINDYLKNDYSCFGISRSKNIDISRYDDLQHLDIAADIIIHTAATASDSAEETFQTNVVGTFNICKYAKEKKVKHLILISSIFGLDRIENEYFNNYGKTKKQSEEVAEAYCSQNNINLTILRLAQVYDNAGMAKASQGMLYYFIDTIKSSQTISIFGNKNPLRNYIHIDYLMAIIGDVIEKGKHGTFNIVENKSHTITEIAYMIFDLLELYPKMVMLKDKPDIPSVFIPVDNRYGGNIESIPLKEGIQRILNYEK